jgi:hypothetical protein
MMNVNNDRLPLDQRQLGQEINSLKDTEAALAESIEKMDEKTTAKLACCILCTNYCFKMSPYFHPVVYTLLSAATCYLSPKAFLIGAIGTFVMQLIFGRKRHRLETAEIAEREKFRTSVALIALAGTRFLSQRFYLSPFFSFILGFDVGMQVHAFAAAYFSKSARSPTETAT